MAKQIAGFLPWMSDDDTVKAQLTLTSEAELDAAVTAGILDSWTYLGSGSVIDANGFNAGAAGGLRIVLSNAIAATLDYFADISYDVESEGITLNDPTTAKSFGNLITVGDQRVLSVYSNTSYANEIQAAKGRNSTFESSGVPNRIKYDDRIYGTASTVNTWRPHSASLPNRYARINMDVQAAGIANAIEGLHATINARVPVANQFKVLVFGSNKGSADFFPYYIKNLQIAARRVVIPTIPALRKVIVPSDSMFGNANMTNSYTTASCAYGFRKYFESRGIRCGSLDVDVNGGFTVADLSPRVDAVIAQHPTLVPYRGLTNDLDIAGGDAALLVDNADPLLTTTGAELLDQMERILGVNGNPLTSTEKVVIGDVPTKPSQGAAIEPYVTAANNIVQAVVDYLNTTYGAKTAARANIFHITNGFDATWGADPQVDQFHDGTHLNPKWNFLGGMEYARAAASIL